MGAGAVAGLRWTVPLIAVAASVAVQTHVGTVPAVALLLVTLGPLALWRWRRDRVAWRRPILAGVLVLAVMWALPVLQQVTGHPGNLSEIADFFTTRRCTSLAG